MNYRILISIFVLVICLQNFGIANDKEASHKTRVNIPEVAMLALQNESNSELQITTGVSNIAGDQIRLNSTNQPSVWLNYSSVVAQNQKRKITATVVSAIPNGVVLKVKTQVSNVGVGETGTGNGTVQLSNSPADIISGIGSCYTGSGLQNGQQLSYEIVIDNEQFYKNEDIEDFGLSVVYTLTDDN